MVHIKFTGHPRNPIVSSEVEWMVSNEALETSAQQREASMEATSLRSAESDRESRSGDSRDNETASITLSA
jgi:carbonic anhydrase